MNSTNALRPRVAARILFHLKHILVRAAAEKNLSNALCRGFLAPSTVPKNLWSFQNKLLLLKNVVSSDSQAVNACSLSVCYFVVYVTFKKRTITHIPNLLCYRLHPLQLTSAWPLPPQTYESLQRGGGFIQHHFDQA